MEFDTTARDDIERERRDVATLFLDDDALVEAAVDHDPRGVPPPPVARDQADRVALSRWAVRSAMNVALAMFSGAADAARREVLREAASWLEDEFPRHREKSPIGRAQRQAEIVERLRREGLPEDEVQRVSASLQRAGERMFVHAIKGWGGEPLPREQRVALRDVLCALYGDVRRASIVAADAGLDLARLPLQAPAIDFWFEAIEEAVRMGCVGLLVDRARQQYPAHVELERVSTWLGLQ